jgi:hypothetical protein
MADKGKTDRLIKLIVTLRERAKGAVEQFTIDFAVTAYEHQFDPGTTEELLDEAAKEAELEVSLRGKDSAMLSRPPNRARMRRPILRRR